MTKQKNLEHKQLVADIPTIQLDPNSKNDPSLTTIQTLRDTCQTIGFFYLQIMESNDNNNNLSSPSSSIQALLDKTFDQSKSFFSLPLHIKSKYSDPILNRGYTAMEEERLDPLQQAKSGRGDTKEGYYIGVDIGVGDDRYDLDKLSGPNVWPEDDVIVGVDFDRDEGNCDANGQKFCAKAWKDTMIEYHTTLSNISFQTVQLLSSAIHCNPLLKDSFSTTITSSKQNNNPYEYKHYFDPYFKNDTALALLRLLHYSNEESLPQEGIFACGAHSDYGMITLLATDDTPGLQIKIKRRYCQTVSTSAEGIGDGENDDVDDEEYCWIDVPPPPPSTFIVNLGDMLERWTNGMFKSTTHRVLIKPSGTDTHANHSQQNDRYSIPFFYEPQFDTIVKCLDICCDDGENKPKYPPTTSGKHLLEKYRETHADFTPNE